MELARANKLRIQRIEDSRRASLLSLGFVFILTRAMFRAMAKLFRLGLKSRYATDVKEASL